MAKKKNSRQKHQKDAIGQDTSDEDDVMDHQNARTCPHVAKAVNFGRMKKALKNVKDVEKCMDCKSTTSKNVPPVADDDDSEVIEVWLCLQCGHCGCGRNATDQHAILHHKTPRSDCHAVVLSTASMSIWCYNCDDEVRIETSRNLRECVDFISKSKTKIKPSPVLVNGSVKNGPVLSVVQDLAADDVKSEKTTIVTHTKESTEPLKDSVVGKKASSSSLKAIKGLRNLGNTCFFNAVMQNLSQTPWLYHELEQFSKKDYVWEVPYPVVENDDISSSEEIPLKVSFVDYYSLTQALLNFLKQTNTFSQSYKSEVVNPNPLFEQICKKSPQFRGFQQQDSHELLRQLLDGIRNEEIKRQKKGILNAFNLKGKVNPENVDDHTKQSIKAFGSYASHTIVERIFGGQLISTVLCEECRMSSQVFEPFMDLSLPLAEEKPMRAGKVQKNAVADDFGMHSISKKKSDEAKLSKHQERKLKQQARKAAKKKAKITKLENLTDQQKEESDDKSLKEQEDPEGEGEKDNDSNDEFSDADVEDNDDSESVPSKVPSPHTTQQPGERHPSISKENSYDNEDEYPSVLGDRIHELCSKITDIRIRRDSDKQEDLLESLNDIEHPSSIKQKSTTCDSVPENISDDAAAENWSHSHSEQQTKEWMLRSLTTVKPRYQPSPLECSVNSCLNQFTASELLTGSNKFRCENCTNQKRESTGDKKEVVYSNASKQLLIFSPPAVLTLHLKRFQQTGMSLRKLNLFVEFPLILDLGPYCTSLCLRLPHMVGVKDEILYSLYGIVQHSGKLTSGHYTAYVKIHKRQFNPIFLNSWPMGQCNLEELLKKISKVKPPSDLPEDVPSNDDHKWYYVSDDHFNEVGESEVLRCQAYILFYQRIK